MQTHVGIILAKQIAFFTNKFPLEYTKSFINVTGYTIH